jgi:para-nitrobenzyl esterase
LFHRAAVQSGSTLRLTPRDRATRNTEVLLKHLNISKDRIADLQKITWQQILEAQVAAGAETPGTGFSPVVDGTYLPHHPFDPAAPEESATVPLIVSTTLEDAALGLTNFDLDDAGLKGILKQRFAANSDAIYALYRKSYPQKSAFLVQAMINTDSGFRRSAVKQAELKAAQGKAPIYMYQWDWPTPSFGGKFGAVHGLDVAGSFREARDGGDMARVAHELSATWVAFAKTGNPNNAAIPPWPQYDAQKRSTMIFGTPTHLEDDPRSEIRKYWEKMPPATGPTG